MAQHELATGEPSQVQHPWRAMTRTIFQLVVGLAAALPMIVASTGLPTTTVGIGAALAISAVVTRIMALPAVNAALATWVPWLAAEPRAGGDL
ncbi:MAG: hypothetical protein JWN03_1198 [Nocardia sp.]|uniref:hypothetical protein n=1 Tax=Nocardia sp. TaxID=1821 RepID=UPI00262111B6|nr:hypothetical protein [Nocardia sp.]MCU1640923.1 hypothetical protein [Nocardia sp.]